MHPLIEARREQIHSLCTKYRVRRLALFGSASLEGAREVGDFDFLIEFQPLHPIQHADNYFSLLSDLERLLNGRVDLVEFSTLRNPFLKSSIEASQVALYDAA